MKVLPIKSNEKREWQMVFYCKICGKKLLISQSDIKIHRVYCITMHTIICPCCKHETIITQEDILPSVFKKAKEENIEDQKNSIEMSQEPDSSTKKVSASETEAIIKKIVYNL